MPYIHLYDKVVDVFSTTVDDADELVEALDRLVRYIRSRIADDGIDSVLPMRIDTQYDGGPQTTYLTAEFPPRPSKTAKED